MSKWRPISSAPKDRPVDLWVVFKAGGLRWADARWLKAGDHAATGPDNWCNSQKFPLHCYVDKPTATHWMPIPGAPD